MNKNIGEILKKAREEKGLTIEDIARETKIQIKYLKALEDGEFHIVPGKTYLKGFLKNYALVVGIKQNEIISKYEEFLKDDKVEEEIEEVEKDLKKINKNDMKKSIIIAIIVLFGFYVAVNALKMITNKNEETNKVEKIEVLENDKKEEERKEFEVKRIEFKTLEIKANSKVWVEIREDGKKFFIDYLEKDKTVEIKSKNKILVKISHASKAEIIYNNENLGNLGGEEVFRKEF